MKRLRNLLGDQTLFFLTAGVIAITIVGILDFIFHPEPGDILVEAHGMIFDVILFGIILSIYSSLTERRNRIRQYEEEIEDFRWWREAEASYRNAGNIRRLNRLGVHSINLHHSYLCESDLEQVNLQKADLSHAELQKVEFYKANLRETIMEEASLQGADLQEADLQKANLRYAKLQNAIIFETNLREANLHRAKAYEYQKNDFSLAGTDISGMEWISAEE